MAMVTALAITALTGPLTGQRFELSPPELVIGRQGTDLTVPDEEVSRRHVALRPVPGGAEITDLGSLNGTWVDGARIAAPVIVGDGARLRVGATTFALSVAATSPASPAPAGPAPDPFVSASPPRTRRPGTVATRMWLPAALSFAAILGTALAMLVYFSLR
jgi:pSer/pThr/pTyr-binding forkhead associated (FHA) protein